MPRETCLPGRLSRARRGAARALGAACSLVLTFAARLLRPSVPLAPGAPLRSLCPALRILVVRLDGIGDMVLTSPFLRELRRRFPAAHIALVVQPTIENLVARCPYVDEVHVFDCWIPRVWRPFVLPWRAFRTARHLGMGSWDLAILPRWGTDAWYGAFVPFFARATRRIGFSEHVAEEKRWFNRGADRLLTDVVSDGRDTHEVDRALSIVRALGGDAPHARLELWPDDDDDAFVENWLRTLRVETKGPLFAIAPGGGSTPLKQWPIDHVVRLGRELSDRYGATLIAIGGPDDARLARRVAESWRSSAIVAAGETTLRQTASLLRRCDLFVGNDTGPLHLAAAMGTPLVGIFGPTDERRFAPRGPHQRIVRMDWACREVPRRAGADINRDCRSACLAEIGVDAVLRECRAVLAHTGTTTIFSMERS